MENKAFHHMRSCQKEVVKKFLIVKIKFHFMEKFCKSMILLSLYLFFYKIEDKMQVL
jgi:hypothetical protein